MFAAEFPALHQKKIPIIINDKTSEICVDYQRVQIPEGKNHVRYRDKAVEWGSCGKEIIEGFKKTYEWMKNNGNEVLDRIACLKIILKSRYLSGHTQFFSFGLFASTHPELMRNEADRWNYLQKLFRNRALGEQEAEAIMQGDIPCFFRNLNEKNIYYKQRSIREGFFEDSIENSLKKRMQQLSEEDCELQKKTIIFSIRLFGEEFKKKRNEKKLPNGSGRLFGNIEYAKHIAKLILENAIIQGEKIYWMGVEGEENIRIKPVDIYFYSGIAGITVFFRKLYQICGLYGDICRKLEKILFEYTAHISIEENSYTAQYPGMYCGEGSVVYTYQLLYRITGEKKYRKYACIHTKFLLRCMKPDSPFDLLYGNAGAVFVLCQQYIDTNDKFYLFMAQKALKYLENRRIESGQGVTWFEKTEGKPVCSIAHGNSGVLIAYAKMQSILHDNILRQRMYQIMVYEDQFYQKFYGNWADLRKKEGQYGTYAWCNGGVGVIYARVLAKKWNPVELADINLEDKIKTLLEKISLRKEMCLCHGNIGILLMLQEAADCARNNIREAIMGYIDGWREKMGDDNNCLKEMDVGFMNGLAGVGMGSLIFKI